MRKLAAHFLLYTFVIMAFCWGTCVLFSFHGTSLSDCPILYIPYLCGGLSPTIASYAALKHNRRISTFKGWLKMTFDFKHSLLSYLLIPLLAGLFFLFLCLFSGYTNGMPIFAVVFMVPMMLFGGGLEEPGWRGILQPELEYKFGFTIATTLVALLWWFWHLPLFFIRGAAQYCTDYLIYGVNVLGLSFALAAIKKCTGSTWLCVLFHCLVNSLHSVFLIRESLLGSIIASSVLITVSYLTVCLQSRKQLFR